jgi:6 kDa early secretory antigenic target
MPGDTVDKILYNYGGIQEAAASIDRFVQFMNSELDTVEAGGRRLLGTWDSDASNAFNDCVRRWNQNARDLAVLLLQLKDALDDGVIDMAAADRKAAALFPV